MAPCASERYVSMRKWLRPVPPIPPARHKICAAHTSDTDNRRHQSVAHRPMACGYRRSDTGRCHPGSAGTQRLHNQPERRIHAKTSGEVDGRRPFRVTMQTPRRHAPAGGSLTPVRLTGFRWNRWQTSAVYATIRTLIPKSSEHRKVFVGMNSMDVCREQRSDPESGVGSFFFLRHQGNSGVGGD